MPYTFGFHGGRIDVSPVAGVGSTEGSAVGCHGPQSSGLDVDIGDVVTAINNYDYSANTVNGEQVEIIAASIRSANHVTQSALMGADIATVPFGVLKKMVQLQHQPRVCILQKNY